MISFDSNIIKTDVTCLKILNNLALAGIGGHLHVFETNTGSLISKFIIFHGIKIHGLQIDKKSTNLLLFGRHLLKQSSIRLCENFSKPVDIQVEHSVDSGSWILAASWLDSGIATVSIHNKIMLWNDNLELLREVVCEERCLLYSAHLSCDSWDNLVVLSGTIFSEVLIWKPSTVQENELCSIYARLKGHKGVIFSIDYNKHSDLICSSSDDRTAILWKVPLTNLDSSHSNITIEPTRIVHGHTARVFRCKVLTNLFITAGEDSLINLWDFDGKLLKKFEIQQGSTVWALDCNEEQQKLIVGGGDGGVILFSYEKNVNNSRLALPDSEVPKRVGLLNDGDIAVISNTGILYVYSSSKNKWIKVKQHEDLRSYALLDVSKCRCMISLSGYFGQIYIYRKHSDELQLTNTHITEDKSRIFSFHWLSCELFLICQPEGIIHLCRLDADKAETLEMFVLPPSKERWTTTACLGPENTIITGDRKGSIHIFRRGNIHPIQTMKRAHCHLGVTFVHCYNDKFISLGRNSVIKIFHYDQKHFKLISANKTPIAWLVTKLGNILVGFSGNDFILWDLKSKRTIMQYGCGGGHRSFDFMKFSENLQFAYIKDKAINVLTAKWNSIIPKEIEESYHSKEVIDLNALNLVNDILLISGGEDTTLRISLIQKNIETKSLRVLYNLKSHLSSIRSIFTFKTDYSDDSYLVFSGGGRAQIILWHLKISKNGNEISDVICSEQYVYHEDLGQEESEMRIMDLYATRIGASIKLFAACSDGNIKVFDVIRDSETYKLHFCSSIFYKLKCILKVNVITYLDKNILVTMSTDGFLVFWNIDNVLNISNESDTFIIQNLEIHQSGINSYSSLFISEDTCLVLTGGDDNSVVLSAIKFEIIDDNIQIQVIAAFKNVSVHCTQITGVYICENYFLTAGIEQRLAVFTWKFIDKSLHCKLSGIYKSTVNDVQGMQCFKEGNDLYSLIHGKGLEFIKVKFDL